VGVDFEGKLTWLSIILTQREKKRRKVNETRAPYGIEIKKLKSEIGSNISVSPDQSKPRGSVLRETTS
jgi:hypothetical protein